MGDTEGEIPATEREDVSTAVRVAVVADRIPNSVLERIDSVVPDRIKPWHREKGAITFEEGSFQWSPSSPAEYHAKLYHEFEGVEGLLGHHCRLPFERSLEVGCGFGRLSPWLARLSGSHHAIDPNGEAIETAQMHYPHVDFREATAQQLPYEDDSFPFVLTWNVLMHVPPDDIEGAVAEIQRVLDDDGTLLLMENTTDTASPIHWGRSREAYEDMLGMTADAYEPRPVERTYDFVKSDEFEAFDHHMMLFTGGGDESSGE
jgi:2-polyprenyl-3-methyl-5-hydroxy-6-metoxy-1,4-benzoquinol methylase